MVIVVHWLAVISAERCQDPLIPAFQRASKPRCLPCLGSFWVGAAVVSLQNGDLLQCWVCPSALSDWGHQLTHALVAGKCLWSSNWFVSLVCFPRWFLWSAFSLFESWSNIHYCWLCNTHHIQERASHGESFSPFLASPYDKSIFLCHLVLLYSHFFFSL